MYEKKFATCQGNNKLERYFIIVSTSLTIWSAGNLLRGVHEGLEVINSKCFPKSTSKWRFTWVSKDTVTIINPSNAAKLTRHILTCCKFYNIEVFSLSNEWALVVDLKTLKRTSITQQNLGIATYFAFVYWIRKNVSKYIYKDYKN